LDAFISTSQAHNLLIYKRQKQANINVLKSLGWYILKFNNMNIEQGEAVRKAIKKRNTILYSEAFRHKDYTDELTQIDFSFMGVYPIRSKEEIKLRNERKKIVQEYNKLIKEQREKYLERIGDAK